VTLVLEDPVLLTKRLLIALFEHNNIAYCIRDNIAHSTLHSTTILHSTLPTRSYCTQDCIAYVSFCSHDHAAHYAYNYNKHVFIKI